MFTILYTDGCNDIQNSFVLSVFLQRIRERRGQEKKKKDMISSTSKADLCWKLYWHENHQKVQKCDIGRLRNQIELCDHGSTMTTPRPISKSPTQRANRQTADGQTDRGGKEDRDGDGVIAQWRVA